MPNNNISDVGYTGNSNDVTPLNMQNQNSNNKTSQINELKELLNEIKHLGEELAGSSRANQQPQEQSSNDNSEQYPFRNSTRTGGSETTGSSSNSSSQTYDGDNFEIEREIIRQVQIIKMNADKYGKVVEVVGRRAVLARSTNGRGNGYQFEYLLSDGRIVSNDYAWELANAGKLKNIIGSHNKGRKYIRKVGDGVTGNNLGNLPGF